MAGPILTTQGLKTATAAAVAAATATIQWAIASGSADALAGTFPTTIKALYDGLIVGVRAAYANATTTPTFSPDGNAAYTIKKGVLAALNPGDIPGAGYEMFLRFNAADTSWELLNPYVAVRKPSVAWAISSGAADALVAVFSPVFTSLVDGQQVTVRANHSNVTPTPTLKADALTARIIYKSGQQALAAGDIPITHDAIFAFHDDTTDWFELLNPSEAAAGGSYAVGSGVDTITATFAPAITALYDGLRVTVKSAGKNLTSVPTFNPNGLGPLFIYKRNKQALVTNDITPDMDMDLVFHDDTIDWWELRNPYGIQQQIVTVDNTTGLADVNTDQTWFPASSDALTLSNGSEYVFEGVLKLSRAAGVTSHTTAIKFAGTASYGFYMFAEAIVGDVLTALAPFNGVYTEDNTTPLVVKAASTANTEQTYIKVRGRIKVGVSGGGTIIPTFVYSAAPGGIPTRKISTYFKITPAAILEGDWN